MKHKKTLTDGFIFFLLPVMLIFLWQWASSQGRMSELILPAPGKIVANLIDQIKTGQLQQDILSSVLAVGKGFVIGSVLGIFFGILMGIIPKVNLFFSLVFDGIRQVPGIAYFPLIILWFGIGDLSKVVLVALGAFFPVLMNTLDGVRNTDKKYLDLVRMYKVNKFDMLRGIYLPSALPFVCTGLKLGAGTAWASVVVAEICGASSGLGYRIATSQQLMKSDVMIVDIFVIGVLGWLVNQILDKALSRVAKWNRQ